MRAVVWSQRARAEFDSYLHWVAERSPTAAARIGEEVVAWVERLATHPESGHPSFRWPGFRKHSLPARSNFVLYEVAEDRIQIAAFRDGRQDNRNLRLKPPK